jgi:hypothetical protein
MCSQWLHITGGLIVGFSSDHYIVSKQLQNWDGGQRTGQLVSQIFTSSKK